MRILLFLPLLVLSTTVYAQITVVDAAPSGRQNYLPREWGGIYMKPDTTTPLKELIERLNGKWGLHETGKAYWIGYNADMFSIASRKDSAIMLLTELLESNSSLSAKYAAILTLHLIGIERTIKGRFYEEFVNMDARKALLSALHQTELQPDIISLLCRAPRLSDIPAVISIMQKDTSDCWSLGNFLTAFYLSLPVNQDIPSELMGLKVEMEYTEILRKNIFKEELPAILASISKANLNNVTIDTTLLRRDLWGPTSFGIFGSNQPIGKVKVSIPRLLYDVTRVTYVDIGSKLQYYVEDKSIFICTPMTAKQRLLNWWQMLPEKERKKFADDSPAKTKSFWYRVME